MLKHRLMSDDYQQMNRSPARFAGGIERPPEAADPRREFQPGEIVSSAARLRGVAPPAVRTSVSVTFCRALSRLLAEPPLRNMHRGSGMQSLRSL